MYYSKVYRKNGEVLLAVCDNNVQNKTFENDNIKLFVDPDFYGQDDITEDELLKLFEMASLMNLAGKNCVDLAIKMGYVDLDTVLEIAGCPHAQVLRI